MRKKLEGLRDVAGFTLRRRLGSEDEHGVIPEDALGARQDEGDLLVVFKIRDPELRAVSGEIFRLQNEGVHDVGCPLVSLEGSYDSVADISGVSVSFYTRSHWGSGLFVSDDGYRPVHLYKGEQAGTSP